MAYESSRRPGRHGRFTIPLTAGQLGEELEAASRSAYKARIRASIAAWRAPFESLSVLDSFGLDLGVDQDASVSVTISGSPWTAVMTGSRSRRSVIAMLNKPVTAQIPKSDWALDGWPSFADVATAFKASSGLALERAHWWTDRRSFTKRLRRARGAQPVPKGVLRAAVQAVQPGSPAQAALVGYLWELEAD